MRIDSAEALRIGLVDRVVPDTELWNAASEIGAPFRQCPAGHSSRQDHHPQILKDPDKRDMDAIKSDRPPPAWTPRIPPRAGRHSWKNASRSSRGGKDHHA